MTLDCIVCGKVLESAMPDDVPYGGNQPSGGTAFQTHGHYGSTVFDPMNGFYLEITVCDACLADARDARVNVVAYGRDGMNLREDPSGDTRIVTGYRLLKHDEQPALEPWTDESDVMIHNVP